MTTDLETLKARLKKMGGPRSKRRDTEPPVVSIKERKRRKNSRLKGNKAELRVAKLFSEWAGELIRRTPLSGGWTRDQEFGVAGDLICKNKKWPFHVEIKHREGWLFDDLITGIRETDTRSVREWWRGTIKDCPHGKIPLLIFTRNFKKWFVMLLIGDMQKLEPTGWWDFCPNFIHANDDGTVVILLLEDFLRKVQPPKGLRTHKGWVPK